MACGASAMPSTRGAISPRHHDRCRPAEKGGSGRRDSRTRGHSRTKHGGPPGARRRFQMGTRRHSDEAVAPTLKVDRVCRGVTLRAFANPPEIPFFDPEAVSAPQGREAPFAVPEPQSRNPGPNATFPCRMNIHPGTQRRLPWHVSSIQSFWPSSPARQARKPRNRRPSRKAPPVRVLRS